MARRLYSGPRSYASGITHGIERPPDAFLSYTRSDDQNDGGAISKFCKRLANAVRAQTGEPFEIFQDVDGIGLGERWRGKLDQVLDRARFFIPIVTPSYFTSKACREELEKFLRAEADRGRHDLVLPIYYIESEVLEEEERRAADPLAQIIHERQRQDWRDLRFEPFDAKEVRQELVRLAKEIVRARKRAMPPASAMSVKPISSRPDEPDDLAVIREGDFGPELVVLPRGEFMMGSPDGDSQADEDEKPQHRVKIDYRIAVGRYPVTFEEWDRYAEDDAWHRTRHVEPYKPSDEGWGRGKRPVINVSWEDAQGYLRRLGDKAAHRYRLLSEAEWEYACRAGTTTAYHVGSAITHYDANFGLRVNKTREVGSYPPNAWGLYDMHGNVWEWVEDCWYDRYRAAPDDGSAWTSGDCSRRVQRGGSWFSDPRFLRSAFRFWFFTGGRLYYGGFRVGRTLTRQPAKMSVKDTRWKLEYHNPALSGQVTFNYSNNNGRYPSDGMNSFETKWSKASDRSIHLYNDPASIAGVAEAPELQTHENLRDPGSYDMSSRVRTIQEGEHAILKNRHDKYAVLKVLDIKDRTRSDSVDELTFEFWIRTDIS